jgi:hypothetical protein
MRRSRLSPSALNSLDASLIGFVMAGCIAVGYFAGNWLDGRLGTQYWTPILVVLGVVAGAREMWRTVSRIRKSFSQGSFDNMSVSEFRKKEAPDAQQSNRAADADSSQRKPRFFHVPPPPRPQGESTSAVEDAPETVFEDQVAELRRLQREIDELEEDGSSDSSGSERHESK